MNFSCNEIGIFVEALYKFFNASKMCFLSGAIVTDDEGGELYNSILNGRGLSTCFNIYNKIRPLGTHMAFIRNERFKKYREGQANEYDILEYEKPRQYEKILDPKLDYLCNTECRNDDRKCDSNQKEPKGVLMFYPFRVVNKYSSDMSERYLYMKLERFLSSDLKHASAAVKRYVFRIEKKGMDITRREDDKQLDSEFYRQDYEKMTKYYIEHGGDKSKLNTIVEKIVFYNTNVRTRNEVYIPKEVLNLIVQIY